MTYGLATRAPNDNAPLEPAMKSKSSALPIGSWRALDEGRRLELIERALLPVNEQIDSFPLAL